VTFVWGCEREEAPLPPLTTKEAFAIQHWLRKQLLQQGLARMVEEVKDSGGPDRAYVQDGEIARPDLQLVLADKRRPCSAEVKAKSWAPCWASRGYHSTGIAARYLQSYQRWASETSQPCIVVFVHCWEREVRYCSVHSKLWDAGDGEGESMMFVDFEKLPLLGTWNGDRASPGDLKVIRGVLLEQATQLLLDGTPISTRRPPFGTRITDWPPP
jgi:hypothetical protein